MTTIHVQKTQRLTGTLQAPASKSYTHRAMIAASLSNGWSKIQNPLLCDDTDATLNACTLLGARIEKRSNAIWIHGSVPSVPETPINCHESASTLRFLIPIAALCHGAIIFKVSPGLRKRPIGPLMQALNELGIKGTSQKGYPPVTIFGKGYIPGGNVTIIGDVSSQFISGLLFACPLADKTTEIRVTTPLESKPYIELTLDVLQKHQINVHTSADYRNITILGHQKYLAYNHVVPGDFSSSSFLMGAAAITGSTLHFTNLMQPQPDSEIIRLLRDMNVTIVEHENSITVKGRTLKAIDIDASNIPDLVPPCTVMACFAQGETSIYNAKRLRIKESDRLTTLCSVLTAMGASIRESEDALHIKGPSQLKGTVINHQNDHRIAMAAAVAGLKAEGDTVIPHAECVNKSYPTFFTDLHKVGAEIIVT